MCSIYIYIYWVSFITDKLKELYIYVLIVFVILGEFIIVILGRNGGVILVVTGAFIVEVFVFVVIIIIIIV